MGIVALVHPETHFTDEKAAPLRSETYLRLRRHWQFKNELQLYDIDHHNTYGVHVYAARSSISFLHATSMYHPDTVERSLRHDGSGEQPGFKDPDGGWDFGLGAGFYVNATQPPWNKHYRMYDYIVDELPALIEKEFPVDGSRVGISGHSMGGHGALIIALKNPGRFKSATAFSPICSPINCPWGQKALGNYLGSDRAAWREYDTTALVAASSTQLPVLVDQGSADSFLAEQLKTPLLEQACIDAGYPMTIRMQEGYDHSYFFIASFIGDHLAFHAGWLY